MSFDLSQAKVVRQVVIPSFPLKGEVDYGVRFVGKIQTSEIKTKGFDNAAEIIHLKDLSEGPNGIIYSTIVNAVLKSELEKSYPNESYVGRCFKIRKITTGGKKYHTFGLEEIEDPYADTEKKAAKK